MRRWLICCKIQEQAKIDEKPKLKMLSFCEKDMALPYPYQNLIFINRKRYSTAKRLLHMVSNANYGGN
jgi:hypothetical protein